jgi:hypothetical protein
MKTQANRPPVKCYTQLTVWHNLGNSRGSLSKKTLILRSILAGWVGVQQSEHIKPHNKFSKINFNIVIPTDFINDSSTNPIIKKVMYGRIIT